MIEKKGETPSEILLIIFSWGCVCLRRLCQNQICFGVFLKIKLPLKLQTKMIITGQKKEKIQNESVMSEKIHLFFPQKKTIPEAIA